MPRADQFNAYFDPATDDNSEERFRYSGTKEIQLCIGEAFRIFWGVERWRGVIIDLSKPPYINCAPLDSDTPCKPDMSYIYNGRTITPSRPGDLCISPRFVMKDWKDVATSGKHMADWLEGPYNAVKVRITALSQKESKKYMYSQRDSTKRTPGNSAWMTHQMLNNATVNEALSKIRAKAVRRPTIDIP